MDIEVAGFAIEAEIGRGGFGIVYRARQLAFDRPAAIKVLLPNSSAEELARRFAQECRAVGALPPHPNVVTVYSTGTTADGRPYLAMQYLGGGSLRGRIPLPPDTVVALGMKLADGLSAAHAGGVIHRDVKPANVLFDADGEPVLVDFGISSLVGDASLTGDDVALSLGYTPPEMFEGGRPTPAVDVYSLGATLFAALTGRTPFVTADGYTSIPVLAGRILSQPLEDLRPLGVPDDLCRVIETCMAKDPAQRFSSTVQVRAALASLGAGDTIRRPLVLPAVVPAVVPEQDPPAGTPPVRRRRHLLAAAAAVLLLGAGVAAAVTASGGGDPDSTPVAGRPTARTATASHGSASAGSPSAGTASPVDAGDPRAGGSLPVLGGGTAPNGTAPNGTAPDGTAADGTGPGSDQGAGRTSAAPGRGRTTVRTGTAAPGSTARAAPAPTGAADRPPVLGAIPPVSAKETTAIRTRVTASDPDGGRLVFRVTGLPAGLSATSAGVISGTIAGRAATVTTYYSNVRTKQFTVTVTVTDSVGKRDVATKVWTVSDTRYTMPNYLGFRGCNGTGSCHESVRNYRQLGPHTLRCKVAPSKVGKIVAQSVPAGTSTTYGKTLYFTVGAKSC